MLTVYFTILMIACSIGDEGTVPDGTAKKDVMAQYKKINELAKQVETAALELESEIDESRRAIEQGSGLQDQTQTLKQLVEEVEKKNQQLQQEVEKLETMLKINAGD